MSDERGSAPMTPNVISIACIDAPPPPQIIKLYCDELCSVALCAERTGNVVATAAVDATTRLRTVTTVIAA